MRYVNLSNRQNMNWWYQNYSHSLVVEGENVYLLPTKIRKDYEIKIVTDTMRNQGCSYGCSMPEILYRYEHRKSEKNRLRLYFRTKEAAMLFKLTWG